MKVTGLKLVIVLSMILGGYVDRNSAIASTQMSQPHRHVLPPIEFVLQLEGEKINLEGDLDLQKQTVAWAKGAIDLSEKVSSPAVKLEEFRRNFDVEELKLEKLQLEIQLKETQIHIFNKMASNFDRSASNSNQYDLWHLRERIALVDLKIEDRNISFTKWNLALKNKLLAQKAIPRLDVDKVKGQLARLALKRKKILNYMSYIRNVLTNISTT